MCNLRDCGEEAGRPAVCMEILFFSCLFALGRRELQLKDANPSAVRAEILIVSTEAPEQSLLPHLNYSRYDEVCAVVFFSVPKGRTALTYKPHLELVACRVQVNISSHVHVESPQPCVGETFVSSVTLATVF